MARQNKILEEREQEKQTLIKAYISYVKEFKEDPSSAAFTSYIEENLEESVEAFKELFKSVTDLREAAMEFDASLKEFTFSEKDINKEEMKLRIEEAVKSNHRFVISSIVSGKAADIDAYYAVKDYCDRNDAVLILMPVADVKNSRCLFQWSWDPIFRNELILFGSYDVKLNENIMLNSIRVSAKQMDPLTSLEAPIGKLQTSMIVASVKNRLKAVPAMKGTRVHSIMTTGGALTKCDYKNDFLMSQRTSKIAEYFHTIGARVVEIDKNNKNFYTRELVIKDGVITDLGVEYRGNKRPTQVPSAVMVFGDSHSGRYDRELAKGIFECLGEVGNVDEIVLHDLCNAESISHHTEKDFVSRIAMAAAGDDSLIAEIDNVVHYLNFISSAPNIKKVSVVPSNHDDHIFRWLQSGRAYSNRDFKNIPVCCKLQLAVAEGGIKNVLQFLVENLATVKLTQPDKIQWLCEDVSYRQYGIEFSLHGDRGANGAKGSLKTFQKAVPSAVVAHTHSMAILDEIYQVGTTSNLDLIYNKGLSSWTRTCCLCYPNGTKQLVTFQENADGSFGHHV